MKDTEPSIGVTLLPINVMASAAITKREQSWNNADCIWKLHPKRHSIEKLTFFWKGRLSLKAFKLNMDKHMQNVVYCKKQSCIAREGQTQRHIFGLVFIPFESHLLLKLKNSHFGYRHSSFAAGVNVYRCLKIQSQQSILLLQMHFISPLTYFLAPEVEKAP